MAVDITADKAVFTVLIVAVDIIQDKTRNALPERNLIPGDKKGIGNCCLR